MGQKGLKLAFFWPKELSLADFFLSGVGGVPPHQVFFDGVPERTIMMFRIGIVKCGEERMRSDSTALHCCPERQSYTIVKHFHTDLRCALLDPRCLWHCQLC